MTEVKTGMKLSDVIAVSDTNVALDIIIEYYYNDEPVEKYGQIRSIYRSVLDQLSSMEPIETDYNLSIEISKSPGQDPWYTVVGVKESGVSSVEYVLWQCWLAMPIVFDTAVSFSGEEIVAHALYEMTWAGYTQDDIQARFSSMSEAFASAITRAFKEGV